MADGEVFTDRTGQGLVVSTGILGDLVLGAFDPGRADEIRALAAQAAVYATQARGPGTLRAEPPRVFRRPVWLSHAAMAAWSV
jgi:hypothetical protein